MIRGTCKDCKYFRRLDSRRFLCTGWVMMLDKIALDSAGCMYWSGMGNNIEALNRRAINEDKEESEKWKRS